jgi:hypothetical protein
MTAEQHEAHVRMLGEIRDDWNRVVAFAEELRKVRGFGVVLPAFDHLKARFEEDEAVRLWIDWGNR